MAKLNGMEPKLVRKLLEQVKTASAEIRELDGQITQMLGNAGLPKHASYRPAKVADGLDAMVKDVTARLATLEKEHKVGMGANGAEGRGAGGPGPATEDKPASVGSAGGADAPKGDGARSEADNGRPQPKPSSTQPATETVYASLNGEFADHEAARSGEGGDAPKAQSEEQKKAGSGSAKDKPAAPGEPVLPPERPVSQSEPILDTPGKDHPDDVDTSDKSPKVLTVGDTKIVTTPMDPPTAQELRDLLENAERAQPIDMPDVSDSGILQQEGGPRPDGPAGKIDGVQAPTSADAVQTAAGPTGETGTGAGNPPAGIGAGEPQLQGTGEPRAQDGLGAGQGAGAGAPGTGEPQTQGTGDSRAQQGTGGTGQGGEPKGQEGLGGAGQGGGTAAPGGGEPRAQDGAGGAGQGAGAGAPGTGEPQTQGTGDSRAQQGTGGTGQGGGTGTSYVTKDGDVVSVQVQEADDGAVRVLIEHHQKAEPAETPSVQVPAGEYGKGEWTQTRVEPDGPAGKAAPNQPDRVAARPGA